MKTLFLIMTLVAPPPPVSPEITTAEAKVAAIKSELSLIRGEFVNKTRIASHRLGEAMWDLENIKAKVKAAGIETPTDGAAVLILTVPAKSAVKVSGKVYNSTDFTTRVLRTPPLEPGTYYYEIECVAGEDVTKKTVDVTPNGIFKVDFTR